MSESTSTTLPVRLRPLNLPQDIEIALPWYADPEVLYFSEGPSVPPFDKARIEKMYRWLSERGHVFVIEVFDETWRPVGDAALCETLMPIVIGDAQYRNRGVGSQALQLLIDAARSRGWRKLVAHKIFAYNARSMKLFEKAGFVRTDTGVDDQEQAYFRYEKTL
jgi:RimJ/RimL family protein N-acetyltransferase